MELAIRFNMGVALGPTSFDQDATEFSGPLGIEHDLSPGFVDGRVEWAHGAREGWFGGCHDRVC